MPPCPAPSSGCEPSHWDPLVIALVGFICSIFLFFSYHRILWRHCGGIGMMAFSRNPTQIRRLNGNNPDSPSLQFQSRGLDSFVMYSLPITQFKKKKEDEELCCQGQGNTDCAVCLGEFEDGEWLKHLPNCSHVFHVSCIDTWFQTHSSCPLCRSFAYNLIMDQHSVSVYALLEALRREETHQERAEHFQALRDQILHSSAPGLEPQVTTDVDHSASTG